MKILIVGGGIAGCTLAFFFKQHGFTPVVVEKQKKFERVGYLLGLRETGIAILEEMGLTEELERMKIPLESVVWNDISGRKITTFDAEEVRRQFMALLMNRADLHLSLYRTIKDKVDFRMGVAVTEIEQEKDSIEVTFSDSKKEHFDLLIGADGVHSGTRNHVFGQGFEKFLGQAFFAFIVPNRVKTELVKKKEVMNVRGPDFFISFGMFSKDESEVGAYVIYQAENYQSIPLQERKAYLLKQYAHYDANFKSILESLKQTDFIYHGDLAQIIMPEWHKGRVALLGDAAYCLTLASGMGASMSMAGAKVLADRLFRYRGDYEQAFLSYEREIQTEVERLQAYGARMGKFVTGSGIIPYEMMNTIFRMVPSSVITNFFIRPAEVRVHF